MQESAEQHSVEEYNLFNMKLADERKPYTVTLEVNGKPLAMELDTGASYSVISGATHKLLWPQKQLMPTTVKLRMYTEEPLGVKGKHDGSSPLWSQRGKVISFGVNR